jgi:hypothetical protein
MSKKVAPIIPLVTLGKVGYFEVPSVHFVSRTIIIT